MALFRVTACVGQTVDGFWRVKQVPTFLLDGDVHGLLNEREAEAFATRLLTDLAGHGSSASACACAI